MSKKENWIEQEALEGVEEGTLWGGSTPPGDTAPQARPGPLNYRLGGGVPDLLLAATLDLVPGTKLSARTKRRLGALLIKSGRRKWTALRRKRHYSTKRRKKREEHRRARATSRVALQESGYRGSMWGSYLHARRNAKRDGIGWELSFEQWTELWGGAPLVNGLPAFLSRGRSPKKSVQLRRRDKDVGYTVLNTYIHIPVPQGTGYYTIPSRG